MYRSCLRMMVAAWSRTNRNASFTRSATPFASSAPFSAASASTRLPSGQKPRAS